MTATMLLPWAFGIICSKTGFTCSRFCASPGDTPSAIAVNASFTKTVRMTVLIHLPSLFEVSPLRDNIGCHCCIWAVDLPLPIYSFRRLRVGRKGLLFSADTPKVRLRQTSNFQFRVLPLHIRWRGPKIKRDLLATPFQYLFLVYCSVEKLMHQRPNPIHFFFQREMARVEKMELCTGNISFVEFSTLHRKDSIVFAPSDQHGGLLFTEILLPIGIDIQIPFCVVED